MNDKVQNWAAAAGLETRGPRLNGAEAGGVLAVEKSLKLGRDIFTETFHQLAAMCFGERQGCGRTVDKASQGVLRIIQQTLADGNGIKRQREPENQCVPAVGAGFFDRL